MPTPTAHCLWGLLFYQEGRRHLGYTPTLAVCFIVVLSALPDCDYLLWFAQPVLMPVHRLFTHSGCFVMAGAVFVGIIAKLPRRRFSPVSAAFFPFDLITLAGRLRHRGGVQLRACGRV